MDTQLYELQERTLSRLQASAAQLGNAKLCGGTALARCWLQHRVSCDLDFFLPHGFQAMQLALALKHHGTVFEVSDMVDDPHKANQLHGFVVHKEKRLKVSFIEDAFYDVYPGVQAKLGG